MPPLGSHGRLEISSASGVEEPSAFGKRRIIKFFSFQKMCMCKKNALPVIGKDEMEKKGKSSHQGKTQKVFVVRRGYKSSPVCGLCHKAVRTLLFDMHDGH